MASKNNAVKVAMATHKRFAEGDLETIINSWSKDIKHTCHATTNDLPHMGIINGVEDNKKWLMVFGGHKQRYVSKPTEFYPVSDTECFNCCEVILQDGSVINEVMYWKSSDGEHIDEWRLFGNPLAYKMAVDAKDNKKFNTKFEAVYPSSSVPAQENKAGTRSAAELAKFCHDNFAKGNAEAIVGIWADDVVHAVANRTATIPYSGVYFGIPQGAEFLKSFASAGVKYKLLETHPVNDCMCFSISECTYADGSKGQECMRWVSEDGKMKTWTLYGNTVRHGKK